MTTTTELTGTNDLRFSTSKNVGNETIYVNIRLNDECKNGHQDFSITGDVYMAGKPKIDKYHLSGGCIHEDIENYFPEFIPFIRLHLCDYKGIPMYVSANGFYHLRNGFNNTKTDNVKFQPEYCEYYRISTDQFIELNKCENEMQFSIALYKLGILDQWEKEANKAIEQLENLTGKKFIVDSVRTQYTPPTNEQLTEEESKIKEGYYTTEAKEARKEEKRQSEFKVLEEERQKKINQINMEYDVKKSVLTVGGTKALKNCIYYNHTRQIKFNWYDNSNNLTENEIKDITDKLQLPIGVTIDTKK